MLGRSSATILSEMKSRHPTLTPFAGGSNGVSAGVVVCISLKADLARCLTEKASKSVCWGCIAPDCRSKPPNCSCCAPDSPIFVCVHEVFTSNIEEPLSKGPAHGITIELDASLEASELRPEIEMSIHDKTVSTAMQYRAGP